MRRRHLKGVMAIERQVYPRPWSPSLFLSEMTEPRNRAYLVARLGREVVGYGGLMSYGDEAHVTTIAVDPDPAPPQDRDAAAARAHPRAQRMGARAVSLEVRVSQLGRAADVRTLRVPPGRAAQGLLPGDQRGRAGHVGRRRPRPRSTTGCSSGSPPRRRPRGCAASREGPGHRDVLRRDRRGGGRGRPPRPVEPGRPASSTSTASTAASSPRSPRGRTSSASTRPRPGPGRGGRVAGRRPRRRRRHRGPRAWSARSSWGSPRPRRRGRAGPAAPGREPPGGPRLRERAGARPARVARSWPCSSRAGTPCSCTCRGAIAYEVLGQTLDDAAGEAFDKIARFLGLPYPGRAGDRQARDQGTRRPSRSRGRCADRATTTSRCPGLKTAVLRHVRREAEAGRERRPRGPGRVLPGGHRRRPGRQDDRGGPRTGVRRGSCWGWRRGEHPAARADADAAAARRPRAAPPRRPPCAPTTPP